MPSRRRPPRTSSTATVLSPCPQPHIPLKPHSKQARLVHLFDEVAGWQRNPYIHSGFRPESRSYISCLRSLTYLHNQTVNIYSHALAVPLIWTLAALLHRHAAEHYPSAGWHDTLVFSLFFTGMTFAYACSAGFHTFSCHSEAAHGLWLRLDLLGIIAVIAGCFPPGLYYTFYCMEEATKFRWIVVAFVSQLAASSVVLLVPAFRTPAYSTARAFFFVALGLSAFFPTIAGTAILGPSHMREHAGGLYYLLAGLTYLASAAIYAKKWPEKQWPGGFDIWGSSHQLFHVAVVIGLLFHLAGFVTAFRYHHSAGACEL